MNLNNNKVLLSKILTDFRLINKYNFKNSSILYFIYKLMKFEENFKNKVLSVILNIFQSFLNLMIFDENIGKIHPFYLFFLII